MNRHVLLVVTAMLLVLGACNGRAPEETVSTPTRDSIMIDTPTSDSGFQVSGTVHRLAVEGGCWRFDAEDGRHFELTPSLAPAELLADGQAATLELRLRPDQMSTCQVAPLVEVMKVM